MLPLILCCLVASNASSAPPDFKIGPVPNGKLVIFKKQFTQYLNVFGIHLFGTSKVPPVKLRHAAIILAEYLDNDEDGEPDNPDVLKTMIERNFQEISFNDLDRFHIFFGLNEKNPGEYILDKNIYISKNLFLPKNTKLIVKPGVEIIFNKNVSIISEGSIYFNGSNDRPIIIRSNEALNLGSIILKNNFFHINNVVFNNLSSPNFFSHILHGGINVIESELEFKNSKITNSKSEDAINVISSTSIFENIELNNIFSDGIDIDFGKFKFQNIKCSQINNDCLDISGSIVNGNEIYAENIFDKGLSIGEASIAEIENIYLYKNKLGIAVKDGSKVKINNYNFDSNTYDMAVYTKKNEYKNSSLYIDGIKDFDDKKIFVGKSNELIINGNIYKIKKKNSLINGIFY